MIFRLGIFGVLFLALIGVLVFAFSILEAPKPQVASAPTSELVMVAATQLPGGHLLQPTDVASEAMAIASVPAGAVTDTPANRSGLVGSMLRVTMGPGTPILNSDLIHPGDHGFLAAVLAPGMRAVTVAVDGISGAEGLIWPGDNVDVLLTQDIAGAPDTKSIAAEVVLSNVRVIATGTELIKDASAANSGTPADSVTLEVTPNQASRCLVATNLGKLTLIVHSAQLQPGGAPESTQIPEPVWSGDVSPALANQHPNLQSVTTVKVFQGSPSEQDYSF